MDAELEAHRPCILQAASRLGWQQIPQWLPIDCQRQQFVACCEPGPLCFVWCRLLLLPSLAHCSATCTELQRSASQNSRCGQLRAGSNQLLCMHTCRLGMHSRSAKTVGHTQLMQWRTVPAACLRPCHVSCPLVALCCGLKDALIQQLAALGSPVSGRGTSLGDPQVLAVNALLQRYHNEQHQAGPSSIGSAPISNTAVRQYRILAASQHKCISRGMGMLCPGACLLTAAPGTHRACWRHASPLPAWVSIAALPPAQATTAAAHLH